MYIERPKMISELDTNDNVYSLRARVSAGNGLEPIRRRREKCSVCEQFARRTLPPHTHTPLDANYGPNTFLPFTNMLTASRIRHRDRRILPGASRYFHVDYYGHLSYTYRYNGRVPSAPGFVGFRPFYYPNVVRSVFVAGSPTRCPARSHAS